MKPTQVDPEAVRAAHKQFPTGVTVVTTQCDEGPVGLAVNAFASVSLSPPLVVLCVSRFALTHQQLICAPALGVNILSETQESIATRFARSGGDKFSAVAWHAGPLGSPLLDGAAAHFDCSIEQQLVAGTHTMFVCQVAHAEAFEAPPLVYFDGQLWPGALGVVPPPAT